QLTAGTSAVNEPSDRLRGLKVSGRVLARLAVANQFELDLLAFVERLHARALDGGDVHEHILSAAVRLNEAEALGGVEPFYRSGRHDDFLSIVREFSPRTRRSRQRVEIEGKHRRCAEAHKRELGRPISNLIEPQIMSIARLASTFPANCS